MVIVSELKAENRVADPLWSPVGEEQVQGTKLRQINRPVAPTIRVIGLGAVIAVAQVVDRDTISVDVNRCGSRNVSLPIAIVRRSEVKPLRQDNAETGETKGGPEAGFGR